jgi:hypothetical protein
MTYGRLSSSDSLKEGFLVLIYFQIFLRFNSDWFCGFQSSPYSCACISKTSQHTSQLIYGSVPSFSLKPINEAVGLSQAPHEGKLLGLLGPYHQNAINTFNTCSHGPIHWSLTDTGGGYSLNGAGFPHATSRPSQPTVLPFPPKRPARSPI